MKSNYCDVGAIAALQLTNDDGTIFGADTQTTQGASFVFVERPNISGFTIGSNAADPEVVGTGFQPHLYLGQGGDDRIFGGQGADEIHGGDGNDVLVGEPTNAATYNGGTVLGAGDVLYGDAGDDILLGGVKNDVLRGGTGNDYVQGDAGDDTIYVEGGEDRYYGMYGYYGNEGADRFVIEQDNYAGTGILRNFIGDFDVNQAGEKIDLSGLGNVRSFGDSRSNVASASYILVGNDGTVMKWIGNSRRWWDGEQKGIDAAGNDERFEMRTKG